MKIDVGKGRMSAQQVAELWSVDLHNPMEIGQSKLILRFDSKDLGELYTQQPIKEGQKGLVVEDKNYSFYFR